MLESIINMTSKRLRKLSLNLSLKETVGKETKCTEKTNTDKPAETTTLQACYTRIIF